METHEKLMLINPKELQQQVLDYIRVLLYNKNNIELKRKIEDYFYKKEWKEKRQF